MRFGSFNLKYNVAVEYTGQQAHEDGTDLFEITIDGPDGKQSFSGVTASRVGNWLASKIQADVNCQKVRLDSVSDKFKKKANFVLETYPELSEKDLFGDFGSATAKIREKIVGFYYEQAKAEHSFEDAQAYLWLCTWFGYDVTFGGAMVFKDYLDKSLGIDVLELEGDLQYAFAKGIVDRAKLNWNMDSFDSYHTRPAFGWYVPKKDVD